MLCHSLPQHLTLVEVAGLLRLRPRSPYHPRWKTRLHAINAGGRRLLFPREHVQRILTGTSA